MTRDKEIINYDGLLKKIKTYITTEEELARIDEAYQLAIDKHFSEKRLTGEDYIHHPLAVAYILAEVSADSATLSAALLHDVLEDARMTKSELSEQLGTEVADLVDGFTKINRLNFGGDSEAILNNQRKILVGLTEDVRVIIIKLADRLHNMRTLWVLPEKTQKEKAKETLDILIPIAHRLGMNKIKSELEDLSLRYYKPEAYFSVVEKLNQSKKERDNLVLEMQESVSDILSEHHIKHEIKGRAKSIYSIYKKLDTGRRFSDIYDLLALRVFVDTEADCYQALGIIHSKYRPIPKRFKDYIAMPKTNMYQSLHTTVFGIDGHLFEIQIRTYEMDQIAEHGIASHWAYKEKKSLTKTAMQNEMEQKLQFFRSIIELKEEASEEEFAKSAQEDVFKDSIYVFTPQGDVIELPKGATPIDFAYKVHSGVGDKMVGAVVNNSIVPLDYELQDNDIVKINTNKNSVGPSKEWINMAATNQAKNKIKAFFNRLDKNEYIAKGEDLLTKELRKRKISTNDFMQESHLEKLFEEFHCGDLNEFYILLGSNKITSSQVLDTIYRVVDTKEEIILKKTQNKEVILPTLKNDIIVEGIDDIKVNLASCCKPVPGDEIVGYITKGYGITIHRMVCPNVNDLEERLIDVRWNTAVEKKYPTSVLVHSSDDRNILLEIISRTSNSDIHVQSINTLSSSAGFLYEITVLVESRERLQKFMNDIGTIPSILDVERSLK